MTTLRRLAVRSLLLALVLTLLAAWLPALARADTLDQQVREIASVLRCPVCENVSTADSSSELAVQMRQVIREQLQRGWSRQQIVDYFLDRYGESVLYEPPKRGFGLLAWLATPLAMLAGAIVIWRMAGRRPTAGAAGPAATPAAPAAPAPAAGALDRYRAQLRAELAEQDRLLAAGSRRRREDPGADR
jgi:cytochrome c-type biogenesis protein CcmH